LDSQIILKSDDPVAALYWFQVLDNNGLAPKRGLVQAETFARRAIQLDSSAEPRADALKIVIHPNFIFTWQMPNTDLQWVQLPDLNTGHSVYRSRLLSLSIERGRSKGADLDAEVQ
jgi:hypothetical protein